MAKLSRKRNYVNNRDLLDALIKHKEREKLRLAQGKPLPNIPNYVGECIMQIANRLSFKPNFSGYIFRDEMISDGIENAIKAVPNFNPEKTENPFAYFTMIVHNAFLRRIAKEKKNLYTKHKVLENVIVMGATMEMEEDSYGDSSFLTLDTDYMNDFVKEYEAKMERDKEKNSKAKKKTNNNLERFYDE